MNFSQALDHIKQGKCLRRGGWNGPDQFIFLVAGSNFITDREPLLSILGEGVEVTYLPHIDIRTQQGTIVPWLASQGDLMAEDWETTLHVA